MSVARTERVKLTAGLLNSLAAFSITAGGIAPLIALSYGFGATPSLTPFLLGLVGLIWLSIGAGLHLAARFVLGVLDR